MGVCRPDSVPDFAAMSVGVLAPLRDPVADTEPVRLGLPPAPPPPAVFPPVVLHGKEWAL